MSLQRVSLQSSVSRNKDGIPLCLLTYTTIIATLESASSIPLAAIIFSFNKTAENNKIKIFYLLKTHTETYVCEKNAKKKI